MSHLLVLPNTSVLYFLSLRDKSNIYPSDSDGNLHPHLGFFSFLLLLVEDAWVVFFFSFTYDYLPLPANWDRVLASPH